MGPVLGALLCKEMVIVNSLPADIELIIVKLNLL